MYFTLLEYMFQHHRSTRTRLQNISATEIENLNKKKIHYYFEILIDSVKMNSHLKFLLKPKFFNPLINDMTGTAILLENHCPTS